MKNLPYSLGFRSLLFVISIGLLILSIFGITNISEVSHAYLWPLKTLVISFVCCSFFLLVHQIFSLGKFFFMDKSFYIFFTIACVFNIVISIFNLPILSWIIGVIMVAAQIFFYLFLLFTSWEIGWYNDF